MSSPLESTSRQQPDEILSDSLNERLPSAEFELADLSALKDLPEYAELVSLLKRAYSGEEAAAFAYQGHARSVSDPLIGEQIKKIERDEWVHRKEVGLMLSMLDSTPAAWREVGFGALGKSLSALCHISGYRLPIYCAGELEASNVKEYIQASQLADSLGLEDMAVRLKEMADTEKQHEIFFKELLSR